MPQQAKRLAVLFAVLIVGLAVARHFLVPPTFGELGHYRSAAVDSVAAQPIRYAGQGACAECHPDIFESKENSRHRTVACEVCHGPAAMHADDPGAALPTVPQKREGCPLCHAYNASKPTGFPQIDPMMHNPMQPCVSCHDPHQPVTPHTPEECSACHGEIARTKAVSPHALLSCTQCHEASDEHKANPRLVAAARPRSREVCGGCHAQGSAAPAEVPRVEMETHGAGHACWECHYPHHPEAR